MKLQPVYWHLDPNATYSIALDISLVSLLLYYLILGGNLELSNLFHVSVNVQIIVLALKVIIVVVVVRRHHVAQVLVARLPCFDLICYATAPLNLSSVLPYQIVSSCIVA